MNEPAPPYTIGYCTNVHPGVRLVDVKQNLENQSLEVKRQVSPDRPLGVGLWISESVSNELATEDAQADFRNWLQQRQLVPYTINAFPFGDFHQPIVKQNVYLPTWADATRLDYTRRAATAQDQILPAGIAATISTLPLGWPEPGSTAPAKASPAFYQQCANHLLKLTEHLDTIAQASGRAVRVCLEPEPGCVLDCWQDIVAFFENYLYVTEPAIRQRVDQHLGVCHDICHSAVMFEPQAEALDAYRDHGIHVGKVQVSAAIEVDFESLSQPAAAAALLELRQFAEPKYLHQTCVRQDGATTFYEDLSLALSASCNDPPGGCWRVHFHVPIFAQQLGVIHSTQSQISQCMNWFQSNRQQGVHFEIETYAWNVLPTSMQPSRLCDGVAKEIAWFLKQTQANWPSVGR